MHSLQWIIEGNFNHYVKTRVTYFHCRPGKVMPRPGPQPATLLFTSPGPARACKFQARTRPGPQNIIEARPGPWAAGRPGPRAEARPVQDPNVYHTVLCLPAFQLEVAVQTTIHSANRHLGKNM